MPTSSDTQAMQLMCGSCHSLEKTLGRRLVTPPVVQQPLLHHHQQRTALDLPTIAASAGIIEKISTTLRWLKMVTMPWRIQLRGNVGLGHEADDAVRLQINNLVDLGAQVGADLGAFPPWH
jgi:hypothetical protein